MFKREASKPLAFLACKTERGGRAPPASHSHHPAARKHKCIGEFSASLFSGSSPFHFQIPPRHLPRCKYPVPFPKVVGRADFPSWPILPGANCVSDGKFQLFSSGFPAPHLSHRLEIPPVRYGYGKNRSLFLSKITFISFVSLTSVSVWSHISTLTGNSHQLQDLGSTSSSPWAIVSGAASSAMPPTSKRIPPAHGLTQEEGNRMPCSLSSTSPQPPLYHSSLGPQICLSCHGPQTSGTALLVGPLQAVVSPLI